MYSVRRGLFWGPESGKPVSQVQNIHGMKAGPSCHMKNVSRDRLAFILN